MNKAELISKLIEKKYQEVMHPEVALRPLNAIGNIFNQGPVIDYLQANPMLLNGFKPIDDFSHSIVIGITSDGYVVKIAFKSQKIIKIVFEEQNPFLKRIKLTLAYDGTNYSGFQRQSTLDTIQSRIENALLEMTGKQIVIHGASRTDAGVHAYGQVIHFDTDLSIPEDKWVIALNNLLPKDIRVNTAETVSQLFHSRFDVVSKEYRYVLNLGEFSPFTRQYEWTVPYSFDLDVLKQEINKIEGTHDFSSFCKGEKDSKIRTIFETKVEQEENRIYLTFIGNGFLHNMIRILVMALINIASKRIDKDILTIIEMKNRNLTKQLAPSNGLYLMKVNYQ